MTKYYTNFEDASIGAFPAGWTRRYGAADNPANNVFAAEYGTPLVKLRQVRHTQVTSTNAHPAAITLDAVDADANNSLVEILTLVKRVNFGSPQSGPAEFIAYARASSFGSPSTAQAVAAVLCFAESATPSSIVIRKYVGGVATDLGSAAFVFDPNTLPSPMNYNLRFRVDALGSPASAQLQARVWLEGTAEPSTWNVQLSDNSVTGNGSVGWQWRAGGTSGVTQAGLVNYFSVGTNGDTAFKPKLNSEYTAWLGASNERRVLAEMVATGFDSTGGVPVITTNGWLNIATTGSPQTVPCTTPNKGFPAGDFSMRIKLQHSNPWVSASGAQALITNSMGPGITRSVEWRMTDGGTMLLALSVSGAVFDLFESCTAAIPTASDIVDLAVVFKASNGMSGYTVTFYTSTDTSATSTSQDGTGWQVLGVPIVNTTSGAFVTYNNLMRWAIAMRADGAGLDWQVAGGKVFRAQIRSGGLYGTLLYDMNPNKFVSGNTLTADTGEVWTANSPSTFTAPVSTTVQTKTVNAYVANGGFTSQPFDAPANQHYDTWIESLPTFSRSMDAATAGEVRLSFGNIAISNPRAAGTTPTAGGVRDVWLRVRWKRGFVRMLLGDPSWARADFRTILYGRLGTPTAQDPSKIVFPLSDLSDLLDQNFQTNLAITPSPIAGKPKPIVVGTANFVDLQSIDPAQLSYFLSDGGVIDSLYPASPGVGSRYWPIYDNGIPLSAFFAGTTGYTVDAGLDKITTTAAHGMLDGWRITWPSGAAPAPLFVDKDYFVVSSTATTFKVAATPGGAVINLTDTVNTGNISGFGHQIDYTTGIIKLVSTPAGRVTAQLISGMSGTNFSDMIAWVLFTKGALSLDYKDSTSFAALAALTYSGGHTLFGFGIYSGPALVTLRSVVQEIVVGANLWFGISPDGRFQVGQASLPPSSSVPYKLTLKESDVSGLSLLSTIRPLDFTKCPVYYSLPAGLTSGPLQIRSGAAGTSYIAVQKNAAAPYNYPVVGGPLDLNNPSLAEVGAPREFNVLQDNLTVNDEVARLAVMFQKAIGVFEFKTRISALEASIGDKILLTHSRLEWKSWAGLGDDSSPDNIGAVDAQSAIVIGIDVNLSTNDPFPVTLRVMRHIPSYYPTGNLN